MNKKILRVLASENSTALVSNIDALQASPPLRRYVGWRFNPDLGEAGGWERKEEAEKLPYRHEYAQAVREGDLVPADKETAKICGVGWSQQSTKTNKKSLVNV